MEPHCRMRTRGQGPHGPGGHAPAQTCTLLALLLLLPVGCLGAGRAPVALSDSASVNPGELCTTGATCVPRATTCALAKPRPVRQAPNSQTPLPTSRPTVMPSCGSSFEPDPTLRDPAAMARRAPWMVSVRANDIHVCAGSIIASRWVLAVAHCVTRQNVSYTVRVGSPWIDQETPSGADVPVLQVIVNPGYRPQRFWSWIGQANNIGLLKLQHKLNYTKYVWPICLPDLHYELEAGCRCTVMGWGLSRADGEWPQFRSIQEKEVTILDNKECDEFYHNFSTISSLVWIITSQMVCATDPSREQFCYEVTGEPLICSSEGTSYLVGLVSWGAGCRKSEAPPIFVRVSPYQSWIWAQLSGQPLGLRTPSQALLLALPLPLSLLVAL